MILAAGEFVKIDLGCHVDGYISVAAHTVQVAQAESVTGVAADVMNACFVAAELACRMIRPGNTNKQVSAMIKQVAQAYGVSPMSGTIMHQVTHTHAS